MSWRPRIGDLVGVKRLDAKGIVLESWEVPSSVRIFGRLDGAAIVLMGEDRKTYSWSDLYLIQEDDADPSDE